jgi:hypothetical protein
MFNGGSGDSELFIGVGAFLMGSAQATPEQPSASEPLFA